VAAVAEREAQESTNGRPDTRHSLTRDVGRFERREPSGASFWRSLSVLGTVGWSIAIPAAAGAWLGHRLDLRLGSGVRFTLMFLVAGVLLGSAVAARALREHRR
jgi:ATP synthase protein I